MKRFALVLCSLWCLIPSSANAQPYPVRPVRVVVPFSAGGATDIVARALGQQLDVLLKQPFVVDARGGAGGVIGTDIAAKAVADGYTLLMATAANPANASLVKNLQHDFAWDFRPVSLVVMAPYMLAVHPSVAAASVGELISLAKSKPGQLNYASAGVGSSQHLTGELFKLMAHVSIVHGPYKGTAALLADVVGGRVQAVFTAIPALLPYIKAGRLRPLAVTSEKRSTGLPDIPTIGESGVPGFSMSGWFGLVAPSATPGTVVSTLNKAAEEALASAELRALFVSMGLEPTGGPPEQFGAFIKKEIQKCVMLVQEAKITLKQ